MVRTRLPSGCSTVMTALVNAKSVIVSVQLEPGQSGAPSIGLGGGSVVTSKWTLPLSISSLGIDTLPLTSASAGFCPGGCCLPDGFVQVDVGFAVAVMVTRMFSYPNPARSPWAFSCRPRSSKVGSARGPPFRWTLLAETEDARTAVSRTVRINTATRRMEASLLVLTSPRGHTDAIVGGLAPSGRWSIIRLTQDAGEPTWGCERRKKGGAL